MPRRRDPRALWDGFWHRPESPRNLAVARMLLAATALWIVLSRYDLPSVVTYPPEMWTALTPERRLRFFMLFGLGTERVLYATLHAALLAALLGVVPRLACFVAGLLLYHFAALETVFSTPNPYLRGLTIPTLGLLVLSFSRCGEALTLWPRPRAGATSAASGQYRWPLALVQVLFVEIYLFAGYAKLVTSGPGWVSADTVRGYLLALNQATGNTGPASWGYAVAGLPAACWALAWGGLAFELAFPLVLVSTTARWVLLPLAVVFHVANAALFRILFHDLGLLLLFVDWDALLGGRGRGG